MSHFANHWQIRCHNLFGAWEGMQSGRYHCTEIGIVGLFHLGGKVIDWMSDFRVTKGNELRPSFFCMPFNAPNTTGLNERDCYYLSGSIAQPVLSHYHWLQWIDTWNIRLFDAEKLWTKKGGTNTMQESIEKVARVLSMYSSRDTSNNAEIYLAGPLLFLWCARKWFLCLPEGSWAI